MRTGFKFLSAIILLAGAFVLPRSSAAGSADGVAIQYHFAGCDNLAANTNFDRARKIFSQPPAKNYYNFLLSRMANVAWFGLQLDGKNESQQFIRPLLAQLVDSESFATLGGRHADRLDFVLAVHLDPLNSATWQKNIAAALHGPGDAFSAQGFSGHKWNAPANHALRYVVARDWLVVGSGDDLSAVFDSYLKGISQNNRPAAVTADAWLSADVDWPFLATWAPVGNGPFKLARTKLDVTASHGRMHTTAHVTYPTEIPWQPQTWRVPKGLISGPLCSFTAAQDAAAFLNFGADSLRLDSNPFTNQLYVWAMREMPLQDYAAWPEADATNALRKLGAGAPAILNASLAARGPQRLEWNPKVDGLSMMHAELVGPLARTAHDAAGDFLFAQLFPLEPKHTPVPDSLFTQFDRSNNLVYYDWELTGMRIMQWRLLSEIFPIIKPLKIVTPGGKPSPAEQFSQLALSATDMWLAELSAPVLDNTVTEVTRTSPTELTVVRSSQLLFTGIEMVVLSHWLADAPVGPVDSSLLPKAKMSGPGMNLIKH